MIVLEREATTYKEERDILIRVKTEEKWGTTKCFLKPQFLNVTKVY